jgi:hypothetical protein
MIHSRIPEIFPNRHPSLPIPTWIGPTQLPLCHRLVVGSESSTLNNTAANSYSEPKPDSSSDQRIGPARTVHQEALATSLDNVELALQDQVRPKAGVFLFKKRSAFGNGKSPLSRSSNKYNNRVPFIDYSNIPMRMSLIIWMPLIIRGKGPRATASMQYSSIAISVIHSAARRKSITAKHLSLVTQCLGMILALLPQIRAALMAQPPTK